MRASHDPSRVSVTFDESNLVPNAGLLPPAALAQRLDLAGLVDARLHLARHGENNGTKALTVIRSTLTGSGMSVRSPSLGNPLPFAERQVTWSVACRDLGVASSSGWWVTISADIRGHLVLVRKAEVRPDAILDQINVCGSAGSCDASVRQQLPTIDVGEGGTS